MNFNELLKKYNINPKDIECAFVHSSVSNLKGQPSNERLEFVGDSIFNLSVSLHLFENFPEATEGEMSKTRSRIVSTKNLADIYNLFSLSNYLKIVHSPSEKVKANTIEAIVAATFFAMNKDFASTAQFIGEFIIINSKRDIKDYKTKLQEELQKKLPFKIEYVSHMIKGKQFEVVVKNNDKALAKGHGKTKKEAEQNAAKNALKTNNKL